MTSANRILSFVLVVLSITFMYNAGLAQVTLNCESGNRAIEQGNCWGFGAISYSNTSNLVIEGPWSTKSNSLTNNNATACWIKTPWMLVGSGNITFQARLDGAGGGVISKSILLAYIPFAPGNSYGEGTPVQFYTYNFPAFNVSTIRNISVPIPAEIQNSNTAYKFWVSFVGQGGNERAYSDSYVFPGTYWSDPSNSCNPMVVIQDADSDGVADSEDSFPNDPYRAYTSVYPAVASYGTLAFEDSWPNKADYDMNDLVVDYKFSTITNSANNVVEVLGKIVARASGASYKNGFGFQLDGIASNKIRSATGMDLSSSCPFQFQSNGLEANQQYANCIVFDNFYHVMPHPGSGTGINTSAGAPSVPYDTITLTIRFMENGAPAPGGSVPISALSSDKFNFYMIRNMERGNEIHLADHMPSSLVNTALFGTGSDDSNPAAGKYYKTLNNLPWGINIIQGFNYPAEKSQIDAAYLHFNQWAVSSGSNYPDWFADHPGYRNFQAIY